jgi:hypothetical protein
MNWQPHFLRALVARFRPAGLGAPMTERLRTKASTLSHTGPGFGTLVIGGSQRDRHGGR